MSFRVLLFAIAAMASAPAYADGPCVPALRNALKIAGASPDVCETSGRLVPGRDVVLALWSTDPESPSAIPLAAVVDRHALEQGRTVYLYKRPAQGESLSPFLFEGRTVNVAIADFGGRPGWAMWVVPDADYFFAVTTYDPKRNAWDVASFPATDLDARVEFSPGQILVPFCGANDASHAELYFNDYKWADGQYVKADKPILALTASATERAKCRQSGP